MPVPPKIYRWIGTGGGPHLLLPEELLGYWRGAEGWRDHRDQSDTSDYARACRVRTWLGIICCNTGQALVLSGDVGPIAWIPNHDQVSGFLVQWLGVDDETSLHVTLRAREVANVLESPNAEEVEFRTGPSGLLRLFDSAESGGTLEGDSEMLRLLPGSYRVRAGYFKSESLVVVVRQLRRA
jgi:hypothetical protein